MKNSNLFLASKELDNIDIDFGDENKKSDNNFSNIAEFIFKNDESNETIKIICEIISYKKNIDKNFLKLKIISDSRIDSFFNDLFLMEIKFDNKNYIIESKIENFKYKNNKIKFEF